MCLYGAVSKMVVLKVSIHVVVGSNLGEQNLFFLLFFFSIDLMAISFTKYRDFQVSMAVIFLCI